MSAEPVQGDTHGLMLHLRTQVGMYLRIFAKMSLQMLKHLCGLMCISAFPLLAFAHQT